MTVGYRVGPLGHGPLAVSLGGEPLVLDVGHNRYRAPGLWLDVDTVRARQAAVARQLQITLG